jgi:hypothetical protein
MVTNCRVTKIEGDENATLKRLFSDSHNRNCYEQPLRTTVTHHESRVNSA